MQEMTISNNVLIPRIVEIVSMGKNVILTLRGRSMRPWLQDGRDKALLAAPPKTLRRGDVILARVWGVNARGESPYYALHRVLCVKDGEILMLGDGNLAVERVLPKDVIAIAVGFYRKGRIQIEYPSRRAYRLYWHAWLWLRRVRRVLLWVVP